LQKEKAYWCRFFRNFNSFLLKKKKCYDQYAASVYKIIKSFFNYLNHDKCLPVGQFHKQFKLPSHRYSPIVLAPEQLKFLITDKSFEASLSASLKRTKDIFVFGCTVGLRYSDLMRIKWQDIIFTSTGSLIKINTQKTGMEVTIPLPAYSVEIINKYKRKAKPYLLPRLSGTNLNLQVKTLIEKAGWTYFVPKVRHRQGVAYELKTLKGNCYRFCDHITTHTMRRTAITTLLMLGVPEAMVRRISGHAAGSKEFYKYVAIVQDYLNERVKNAFDQLIN
jgi:integrase